MIKHLQHQRDQLLNTDRASASTTESLSLPDRPDREPSATQRLKNPAAFMGTHTAEQVLPALGITFQELLNSSYRFTQPKPVLDVGASFSTVALEGAFRNLPIYSTDLRCDRNRPAFLANIQNNANQLQASYADPSTFPAGFECTPISPHAWHECVEHGIRQINTHMNQCSSSEILIGRGHRAPDQYFSTVFSHHAVPKYSANEVFFSQELPELLRVTAHRLILFPLITAGPGEDLLHIPNSENRRTLERIANENGFSLEIKVSPPFQGKVANGAMERGYDQLGVFTRRH